jgi:hypothetical protein
MHPLLDQEAPGLSDRLAALPFERQQEIIGRASVIVAKHIGKLEQPIQRLIDKLSTAKILSSADAVKAQALADAADDEYFELQERDPDGERALRRFSEARLLTAIATVFSGRSPIDAADAAYELCKACDDSTVALAAIEADLVQ